VLASSFVSLGLTSVADPGFLSRILIFVHAGWISDPGSKNSNKREGFKKKFGVLPFFVATKTTKLKIILI
jgi:hypothetical protein